MINFDLFDRFSRITPYCLQDDGDDGDIEPIDYQADPIGFLTAKFCSLVVAMLAIGFGIVGITFFIFVTYAYFFPVK
jgi:hypothetical protein